MRKLFESILKTIYVHKPRKTHFTIPRYWLTDELIIKQDPQGHFYWVYRAYSTDEQFPSEEAAFCDFLDYILEDLDLHSWFLRKDKYASQFPPTNISKYHG